MKDTRIPPCASRVAAMVFLLLTLGVCSVPLHAQDALPEDGKLKLVVALFRHGIRPPLEGFASSADQYSGKAWPALEDWHAIAGDQGPQWGNLTVRGKSLAQALGRHYASQYGNILGPHGRGVFLWADVDERTQQTALGLKDGFCWPPRSATACRAKVDGLFKAAGTSPKDSLFHPFAAGCGKPDMDRLNKIVGAIERGREDWMKNLGDSFGMLQDTLNCHPPAPTNCSPLLEDWLKRDKVAPGKPDSAPIQWSGAFSYASGASEAFLLEYANNMTPDQVGWGRTNPPNSQARSKLGDMLQLHEFFFDKTQREKYVAKIQGSNLVREILDDLERAAGGAVLGCPRGAPDSKFIGLVGHDTNLASVGALLSLSWKFDGTPLQGMPANDALPAGALIFELRDRGGPGKPDFFVRVSYVTLTPQQMRDYKPSVPTPLWLRAANRNCPGGTHCDITLTAFETMARESLDDGFLSRCQSSGSQVCDNKQ